MNKQIEVEDYGATLAQSITKLSAAMKNTPLTKRAIAILLHDYNKSIPLTDCLAVLNALPYLAEYYTK